MRVVLVRFLLVSLAIHAATAWFDESHPCGDEDTRMHVLKECKNALATLDALTPPPVTEALDEHNQRNLEAAHTSDKLQKAKERANRCVLCVLHGYQGCDSKKLQSGHEPAPTHIIHSLAATQFSQNCKDHITFRKLQKPGMSLFKKQEAMVWGSHSLTAPGSSGPILSLAETDNFRVEYVQQTTTTATVLANGVLPSSITEKPARAKTDADPTLRVDADILPEKEVDLTQPKSLNEQKNPNGVEIGEAKKPYYLCALVNDTKQVDLLCPSDMAITKVLYASYGTPLKTSGKSVDTAIQTNDLSLAEVSTPLAEDDFVRRNGYVLFSGTACFEADFRTRDECSAYNSQSVVEYSCLGASQCTLRATGDPKIFPFTFQKLVCDDRLSLYVKVQCEQIPKATILNDVSDKIAKAERGVFVDDWVSQSKKEVVLNFNDPHQMEFLPGMVSLAAGDSESNTQQSSDSDRFSRYYNSDGVLQRPIVREQIDPPPSAFPTVVYQAIGQKSYICEDIQQPDADGNIYVWRENTAAPKLTYMTFYDKTNNKAAYWDLEENLFRHVDGSLGQPEASVIGEVTDGDCNSVRTVENAPDSLWHIEHTNFTGIFQGIHYVQRTETSNGLPPKTDGEYVDKYCRVWFRCKPDQAASHAVHNADINGMYFFYSTVPNNPEKKGAAGPPGWVWAVTGVAIFAAIALVVGIVYFKVKGAPKMFTSKRARGGQVDEEAKYKLQKTFLYEDESGSVSTTVPEQL